MEFSNELVEIMTPVLMALVGYVAFRVERFLVAKTGVNTLEKESYHRDAMHAALKTGAKLAIDAWRKGETSDDVAELRAIAIAYAKRSSGDAIAALNPDYDILAGIADTKISEEKATAEKAAVTF